MKTCRTCGDELPTAGVMICQECAAALDQMVARKTDAQGFSYIEVGPVTCPECQYYGIEISGFPCRNCRRVFSWNSRDYFKPKEAGK